MDIQFHWIGGATFVLTIGNLKISCDPVLCKKGTVQDYFWFKSKRLEEPFYDEKTFIDIDLWLITHNHEDLDNIGLSKIDNCSIVLCNNNTYKKLKNKGIKDLKLMEWYQSKKFTIKGYEIEVEAIPAIHGVNPLCALLAGKVNGYYLTVSKENEKVKVYVTGDTVYKNKVINALNGKEIDLLIANMGAAKEGSWIMTLTLNSKMLRKMITKLDPKTVIPVHYGTFEHYVEPVETIKKIKDDRIKFVKTGESVLVN
jgi:L-ascorbate metabolism protein UlaG (beta-lactamase superfamily)